MGEKEEKGPVPLLLAECRHWRWNLRRMRRGGDEITGRFYLTTQGKISLVPRLFCKLGEFVADTYATRSKEKFPVKRKCISHEFNVELRERN